MRIKYSLENTWADVMLGFKWMLLKRILKMLILILKNMLEECWYEKW